MITPNAAYPTIPSGYIIRQSGGSFQSERTGLSVAREKFIGYYDDLVSGVGLKIYGSTAATNRSYKTPSPFYPSLLLYTSKISLGKGLLNGILEVEYRGLDPSLSTPPPPVYTLERSTSNEPILTHPNFRTTIAGTPSTGGPGPLNGAIFVDKNNTYNPTPVGSTDSTPFDSTTATFAGWLAKSKYAGVEDYLCPGAIWKKSYVDYNMPSDINSIGMQQTPDGPVPDIFGLGYTWLNTGITSVDNAGLFRIEESWLLSGPNGWDPNIYPGAPGLTPPGTLLADGSITG